MHFVLPLIYIRSCRPMVFSLFVSIMVLIPVLWKRLKIDGAIRKSGKTIFRKLKYITVFLSLFLLLECVNPEDKTSGDTFALFFLIPSEDGNTSTGGTTNTPEDTSTDTSTVGTSISDPIEMVSPAASPTNPSSISNGVATSSSVYLKIPVTPGKYYTITVSGLSATLNLFLYSDSSYTEILCSTYFSGTSNRSCTEVAPDSGFFYIELSHLYSVLSYSTSYIVTVTALKPKLPYSSSDSVAELTGVPLLTSSSVKAGTVLNVTVPVDNDTGYVVIYLAATSSTSVSGNPRAFKEIFIGVAQDVTLNLAVPYGFPEGNYQVVVRLATSASSYGIGLYTEYIENSTSNREYYKGFSLLGYSFYKRTKVDSVRIAVTKAVTLTTVATTCSTSSNYPTTITVSSIPVAWTGSFSGTYCYFKFAMPSASTVYSFSLTNLSSSSSMNSFYGGFSGAGSSSISNTGSTYPYPQYFSKSSDSSGNMYLRLYNSSGDATFTLSTP